MREFSKSRLRSFGPAISGWWFTLRTQPNTWIHAAISLAVIALAFWLRLGARDWALLLLTIALVWTAEFFNTAVEAIVDLVSPQEHPLAKAAKDISAAAVLICAAVSVLVGLLILGPPLWAQISALL